MQNPTVTRQSWRSPAEEGEEGLEEPAGTGTPGEQGPQNQLTRDSWRLEEIGEPVGV